MEFEEPMDVVWCIENRAGNEKDNESEYVYARNQSIIQIPKSDMNLPSQTSLRRAAVACYGEAHAHAEELEEVVLEGGRSACVTS